MVLILISFLISPPDGLDSAENLSKFWLQFLRLMATPWCIVYTFGDCTVSFTVLGEFDIDVIIESRSEEGARGKGLKESQQSYGARPLTFTENLLSMLLIREWLILKVIVLIQ